MKTDLEINIKNTILGWTSIGLVIFAIIEIFAYEDIETLVAGIIVVPLFAIFLIFYWIILIYLWSAFLTVGNDIGTKIVNRITHKKEI